MFNAWNEVEFGSIKQLIEFKARWKESRFRILQGYKLFKCYWLYLPPVARQQLTEIAFDQ